MCRVSCTRNLHIWSFNARGNYEIFVFVKTKVWTLPAKLCKYTTRKCSKRSLCGQIASSSLLTHTACLSCKYNLARLHPVPYSPFIIGAMGDTRIEYPLHSFGMRFLWIVLNLNLHGLLYENNVSIG